jgi:hypothetical protein
MTSEGTYNITITQVKKEKDGHAPENPLHSPPLIIPSFLPGGNCCFSIPTSTVRTSF